MRNTYLPLNERRPSPGHTTYFIHPVDGDDAHSGTGKGAAWRSFAPVNRLVLAAGDRVEIVAPGAFEQTLALTGAGTREAPIAVRFAPGRYDFHPAGALTRRYHISNTNDAPDGDKAIGILLDKASHIHVSGAGARIVYRGKMIEVCMDDCEEVSVTGLSFDYHRPTVSEFTVVAATLDHADLDIHRDSAYRIEEGRIIWQGEGWSYGIEHGQELDLGTDRVRRRSDPLQGVSIEALAPFRVRAHGAHDMVVGRVYQIRTHHRDYAGVFVQRSRNVLFRDVHFIFLHGMGMVFQFNENITLDHVRIAPAETSGRTCAAWADCTHFSGNRGKISMRYCVFSGAHDDATNIHGTHLRIVEQPSPRQVRVRFVHRQTYGFMAFNPGDEIEFVRWDTLETYAPNRVAAAELLTPTDLLLTLDAPVPEDWHENDVIENVTWTPEVEIRGCTVARVPTRGFLLTTRRKVLVTQNTFMTPFRNGIHIECDAEGWFESGCVRDMTITRNTFVHCGKQAIFISPHNSKPNPSVHRNIRIEDNDFILREEVATVVAARGTTGLVVANNRVHADPPRAEADVITVEACGDVTIQGNRYLSLSQMRAGVAVGRGCTPEAPPA